LRLFAFRARDCALNFSLAFDTAARTIITARYDDTTTSHRTP